MNRFKINLFFIIFIQILYGTPVFSDDYSDAETLIIKAKTTSTQEAKYEYLHQANNKLLKLNEENPLDIKILINLSKVNQMLGNRQEAKVYVLKAYNLNSDNPNLQKEMGDFYYNFQEYSTAIEYYKLSLASGNLRDFLTNLQTAKCYEKLGDIENSELYYKISGHINPNSRIVKNKINSINSSHRPDDSQELDKLKYKYLFKEKIPSKEEQDKKEINSVIESLNQGF